MTESIRDQIVGLLETALRGMTTAAGYNFTWNVYREESEARAEHELPAAFLVPVDGEGGSGRDVSPAGFWREEFAVTVTVVGAHDYEAVPIPTDRFRDRMISDVLKAVGVAFETTGLGGLVQRLDYAWGREPQPTAAKVEATVGFSLTYEVSTIDPTSQEIPV